MAIRVLVVDDDPTVRTVLSRLLQKRFGAIVREAADGYAGFLALSEETPDILLLDVVMPIVDGPELLAKLRADPRFERLPVVTISAGGDRDVVMRMIDLGVIDYLRKPLNLAPVQKRLERAFASLGLADSEPDR